MSHKTREQRQEEAAERNEAWAALPFEAKLGRLHTRPGMSQRQRDRLMEATTSKIKQRAAQRRTEEPCRSGHTDCTVDCGWCKGTGRMVTR